MLGGTRDIEKATEPGGKGRKGSAQSPYAAGLVQPGSKGYAKMLQPSLRWEPSAPLSGLFSLLHYLGTSLQISLFLLHLLLILWSNSLIAVKSLLWGFAKLPASSWGPPSWSSTVQRGAGFSVCCKESRGVSRMSSLEKWGVSIQEGPVLCAFRQRGVT